MSNPEEEVYITYDPETEGTIQHHTLEGAESFADEVGGWDWHDEPFVQIVDKDDLDTSYNTFRSE